MAVRTGAGTGVIVSLVVFILISVFLLVLSIVFYSELTDARQAETEAETELTAYVKPTELASDRIKQIQATADAQRRSVTQHLLEQQRRLLTLVANDPNLNATQLAAELETFGVSDGESAVDRLRNLERDLRNNETQLANWQNLLDERQQEIDQLTAQNEAMRREADERVAQLREEFQSYIAAAEQYADEVAQTRERMEQAIADQRNRYEGRIDELENENDDLHQELVVLEDRVDDLRGSLQDRQDRLTDPSLLVDGRVIEVIGSDEVYINRGREQRIELGMTFEVYDTPEAIRVDPENYELPRGVASIQVTEVGEQTSKAKITRSVPGRPVVRNAVIANAVYDPTYKFRFLVHGAFDVNGDGRPSEAEADYIRNLIIDWGGAVVEGDQLPGDLDFLVLGVQPPLPGPLGVNPSESEMRSYLRKREAVENYRRLFNQARQAQIPVLNANRFFILTGTDRS